MIAPRLLLIALGVVGHGSMNGFRLATSLYALHEGLSAFEVGVLFASVSLLPGLGAVPLGRLIDRGGARLPMLLCCASFAAAFESIAAWPSLPTIFVVAPLFGLAFTGWQISLNNVTGQLGAPGQRTASFGWLTLGFAIGSMLGPLLVGICIDAIGHRLTFAVVGVLPLVGIALLAWRARTLPEGRAEGKARSMHLRDLVAAPGVIAVVLVTTLYVAAWDVFIFVVPVYGREIGLSATTIGIIMVWFSAGSLAARTLIPLLARRFDDWTLMAANFFLTALGLALFALSSAAPVLMAIAFVIGIGTGFGTPISFSLSYAVAPPGRQGELSGLRSMGTAVCHVCVPLATGALGAAFGLAPVLAGVAAGVAASGWFSLRQRRARSR
jgi:MFS family permease